jgi:hypothetical protein
MSKFDADKPLTVAVLVRLGMLSDAVERKNHIAWLDENFDRCTGIVRAFTNESGNFLHDEDVRNGFVWITRTDGIGATQFKPVKEMLELFERGELSLDYQP